MTRVDFYVLQAGSEHQRHIFACRLAEKAFRLGLGIYLHTRSAAETARLNDLMWTFRDGSFVPHLPVAEAVGEDEKDNTPIHLGHGSEPGPHSDLLINLADQVPLFFSRFERVAEIVAGDARNDARERFRFYRDRGYSLDTHTL